MTDFPFTLNLDYIEPSAGLTATYVVPSGPQAGTYVFSEAGGSGQIVYRLDDYVDPEQMFVMTCTMVTRVDCLIQVIFRRTNLWSCVIFEACDAFATRDQSLMPASGDVSTVTISDDVNDLDIIEVWGNWTYGRWRWQSCPWPYARDVNTLRTKGWIPRMDSRILGTEPALPNFESFTPMHLPKGWPLYLGGGGNPTLYSSRQGYWLCHPEDPKALQGMLDEAEGLAAYPWFMRDPNTGGVPDIWNTYPTKTAWAPFSTYSIVNVDAYGVPSTAFGTNTVTDERGQQWAFQWQPYCVIDASGHCAATIQNTGYPGASEPRGPLTINNPNIDSIVIKSPSGFIQGSGLSIDEAHSGSMHAAAWLATGDPYYLEALHCKYVYVWRGGGRSVPRPKLAYSQIRQTAWQLASLIVSAYTTPDITPSWLLPKSLWTWLLNDEMRLWDSELLNGSTPGSTYFHTVGATAGGAQPGLTYATWQEDMIAQVMSWLTMFDPQYKRMIDWKIKELIDRNTKSSGWCEQYPEVYYASLGPDNKSSWWASWADAWTHNQTEKRVPTPTPTDFTQVSLDYCGNGRAGLAFATQAGCTQAQQALTDLITRTKTRTTNDTWQRLIAAKPT